MVHVVTHNGNRSKAYSKPSQASKMNPFAKIVHDFQEEASS